MVRYKLVAGTNSDMFHISNKVGHYSLVFADMELDIEWYLTFTFDPVIPAIYWRLTSSNNNAIAEVKQFFVMRQDSMDDELKDIINFLLKTEKTICEALL